MPANAKLDLKLNLFFQVCLAFKAFLVKRTPRLAFIIHYEFLTDRGKTVSIQSQPYGKISFERQQQQSVQSTKSGQNKGKAALCMCASVYVSHGNRGIFGVAHQQNVKEALGGRSTFRNIMREKSIW